MDGYPLGWYDYSLLPKRLKTPKKFFGSKTGAIFWQITSRVTTINLKIGQRGNFEKIDFFSFFLMRKRLSSGQKWFLRPYFPLIRGMFVFSGGLRFSFQALKVPKPRVRKKAFSLTKMTFFSLWPQKPLLTTGKSFSHEDK